MGSRRQFHLFYSWGSRDICYICVLSEDLAISFRFGLVWNCIWVQLGLLVIFIHFFPRSSWKLLMIFINSFQISFLFGGDPKQPLDGAFLGCLASHSTICCFEMSNIYFFYPWEKKKFCFQEDVKSPQRQSDFEISLWFSWCYGFRLCFCLEMSCISFVKTKFRVYLLSFWPARDVTDDGFRDATDNSFGELANSNCKLRKGKQ